MLANLKIAPKLLLMLAIPVLAMFYFAGQHLSTNLQEMRSLQESSALASLATVESAVIHELQKERGLSAGFLGSKGEKFKNELSGQREKTDAVCKKRMAFLETSKGRITAVTKQLESSIAAAQGLSAVRSEVDGLKVEAAQAITVYTKMITADMDLISAVVSTSKNAEIASEGSSYLAFVNAKEQVGRERATLNGAFATNNLNQETFIRYIRIAAVRDQSLDTFIKFANPSLVKSYQEKMAAPFRDKVDAMRKIALEKGTQGEFGVKPEEWFQAVTEQINAMKEVEDQLSNHLIKSADSLAAKARTELIANVVVSIFTICCSFLFGFWVKRSFCKPLNGMLSVLRDLEQGEGDLTLRLEVAGKDELAQVSSAFNNFVDKIHDVVVKVTAASAQVIVSSSQFQNTADVVSQDARSMTSQTISVATASEEMSATSSNIARNCTIASQSAQEASNRAESGTQIVQGTLQVMEQIARLVKQTATSVEGLGARSDQIGAIVGTIEDIADQTNLLALNAAIEAARAGEMGRGFAVVADEVRALAERTTRATREIGEMIKSIQQETGSAVQSMSIGVEEVERGSQAAVNSSEALQGILEEINQLTMEIHQIATAAEEQTATTSEITNNIHQVSTVVKKTSEGTRESISASNRLMMTADEMAVTLASFKINESLSLLMIRAKAAHISFVGKVRAHLDRDIKLTPDALPTHLTCRFGTWYTSAEGKEMLQQHPQLRQLETPHELVHSLGKEVIRAADAGERKKAWVLYNEMKRESEKLIAVLETVRS